MRTLKNTKPFNFELYGVNKISNNTFILIEGNSHTAEVITYWACETDSAEIYKLNHNSMFIRVFDKRIMVLLIDNDITMNSHPDIVSDLLYKLQLVPNLIILGYFNHNQGIEPEIRRTVYQMRYPQAQFFVPPMEIFQYIADHKLFCPADFYNCTSRSHVGHECLPGPIARVVEQLAHNITVLL